MWNAGCRHQRHTSGTPWLHFNVSTGNEEGLLGIVFSSDGKKLYIDYTDPTGDIHIVEFTMKGNVREHRRPSPSSCS